MRTISLTDFLAQRDERIRRAGIVFTPALNEALRNKGARRTPEKRAALKRIEERCAEAGVTPLKAYF